MDTSNETIKKVISYQRDLIDFGLTHRCTVDTIVLTAVKLGNVDMIRKALFCKLHVGEEARSKAAEHANLASLFNPIIKK